MKFNAFHRIQDINEILVAAIHKEKRTHTVDWAVQEMLDGEHLAIYVDGETKTCRIANRHRFLTDQDRDYGWKRIEELYKNILLKVSIDMKLPLIFYGKLLGGNYGNCTIGDKPIYTVCQYMRYNEFFIHDIKLPSHFLGVKEMHALGEKYALKIVPTLYQGGYRKSTKYPDNKLSTIPFISQLHIIKDNQMKGIVIRPCFDLHYATGYRIMLKSLNVRYRRLGREHLPWNQKKSEKLKLTESLAEIAKHISNLAMTEEVLNKTIEKIGGFNFDEMDKISGLYVKNMLDNCLINEYIILSNGEQKLVNKELNKLAKEALKKFVEDYGNKAA